MAKPGNGSLLETLGQVITVLAGVLAFVYLVGGGLMWVRLWREGLPAGAAVSPLPRELLITIGLRDVVIPAIPLALLAALIIASIAYMQRVLTDTTDDSDAQTRDTKDDSDAHKRARNIRRIRWAYIVIAFLVVLVLNVGLQLAVYGVAAQILGWAIGLVAVVFIGWFIATTLSGRLTSFPAVALAALGIGLVAAAVRIGVEVWNPELEKAKVCVNDGGTPYEGDLIGQTSEAVYIGQKGTHRVIAIPSTRVAEVVIGAGAVECAPPPPDQSSVPPSD
jgi:hypothetical protein